MTSLSQLFSKALLSAAKGYNLPTIEDSTQELFTSALRDLTTVNARIADLSLHSSNETLEDISTRSLVYLLVPYATAEVRARISIPDPEARISHLLQTQRYLQAYVTNLQQFEIVTEEERELFGKSPSAVPPAQRRALKIQQYKKEKELRTKVEAIRKRRRQSATTTSSPSDFDLIASILPSDDGEEDDDEDESDDTLREATILLLRLMYTQARNQLESSSQELELLRSAVPRQRSTEKDAESADDRRREKQDADNWRLDGPADTSPSALIDSKGRPLRPFTILPSGASNRTQVKVFGPGHNLPTMTIDEYLEIEQDRGNIVTGGGAASAAEPTSSEQLALDAEMDGTMDGELNEEAKRQKDENWARFTDANPRGAGNTMNRG